MKIDDVLKRISCLQCQYKVDVENGVMRRITEGKRMRTEIGRWKIVRVSVISAVAAMLLAVVVNITIMHTRSYNEKQIGMMLAELYDTDPYSNMYSVESAADEILMDYFE